MYSSVRRQRFPLVPGEDFMEIPTTSDLTLVILILRTLRPSQGAAAEIARCRKSKVVEVDRWFRDGLSYREAVAFADDEAIRRLIGREFGDLELKDEVLTRAQQIIGDDILRRFRQDFVSEQSTCRDGQPMPVRE